MTGDILNEQASAYMADRSIHCIAKPFSRDAFVKVVSTYFG